MVVSPSHTAAVLALRPLGSSEAKRLVVEFAYRRRRRGHEWFSFSEADRVLRNVAGLSSIPNMHRHVLDLAGVNILEQRGELKKARFRLTAIPGVLVHNDWVGASVALRVAVTRISRASRSRDEPTLTDVAGLARNARELMDDLIARVQMLASHET